MIDDKGYATLGAAVADAQDGDTIVMQEDVPDFGVGEDVTFTKNVTLDLGAKTLTFGESSSKTKFVIDAGAEVSITNGTISIPAGKGSYAISVKGKLIADFNMRNATYGPLFDLYGTSEMVVNGGTYGGTGNSDIFRWKEDNATHKITINDGTFAACDYGVFYVYKGGNVADIVLNGGTFEGHAFWCQYTVSADFHLVKQLDNTCLAKFKTLDTKFNEQATTIDKLYVADGFAPVLGNDGYYTIQQVFGITITEPENGTVTADKASTYAGDTVTLTVAPADGFKLDTIAANGGDVTLTTVTEGTTYTFVMPAAAVTVTAVFEAVQTWPEAWDTDEFEALTDEEKKAYGDKFKAWKGSFAGEITAAMLDNFLMNVAPDATTPELKIDSITVEGDTATIVVSAGTADLEKVNGVLYVDGANDLTNWTTTEVDLGKDATFVEGKATFVVDGAKFMKAGVGFKAPVVEE